MTLEELLAAKSRITLLARPLLHRVLVLVMSAQAGREGGSVVTVLARVLLVGCWKRP